MEAFEEAYKRLNSSQKEAVDAIEGPVMVIAGPGTGKTQLLTLRIANILQKTDTPPSGILALTFTENGASAMRERLAVFVGSRAYEVPIYTFHGLCAELVRRYPERYATIIGATLADDVEKIEVIELLLNGGSFEHLSPKGAPLYYVDSVKSAISELKRENVTADSLVEWVAREKQKIESSPDLYHQKGKYAGKMKSAYEQELKVLSRTAELAIVYRRYAEEMKQRKLHDFEDLIVETIAALANDESFLLEVQEQYLYILADEHQDVNASQNTLLELLASFHESPNLFVVGDEKQAIFRFQGASLANFLYFKRRYPQAQIIVLADNYRSTRHILDSAHTLITSTPTPEELPRVPLSAQSGEGTPIAVSIFASQEDELAWVAEETKMRAEEGSVAILYRANQDASAISRALSQIGVVHTIQSDFDALEDPLISQFLALLRAIDAYGDDSALAPILYFGFLGIDVFDAHRAIVDARRKKMPIAAILDESPTDSLRLLCENLKKWKTQSSELPLAELLDAVARRSGFLARLAADARATERFAKLKSLYKTAEVVLTKKRDADLGDYLRHLSLMSEHRVRMNASPSRARARGVELMTVHKSKGLEYDSVFVVGLVDGAWGARSSRRLFRIPYGADALVPEEGDDEERRLLYVAMTRAKENLSLSYFEERLDGAAARPSRFIAEIDPTVVSVADRRDFHAPLVTSEIEASGSPLYDPEYVRELLYERGLSITAVNDYIDCPLRYFFVHLIGIPTAKPEAVHFGIAAHRAIAFGIQKSDPSPEHLIEEFTRVLSTIPLPEHSYRRLLERGSKGLPGFLKTHPERFTKAVKSEVRVVISTEFEGFPEPLTLKGDIDALETTEEGVRIIDFKTGKPKSKGIIEGTAKAERAGDYQRQLLFYKKLLTLNDGTVAYGGVIDFVEPNARGGYESVSLELSEPGVSQLWGQVERIAREIYDAAFFNSGCAKHDCEYCKMAKSITEAGTRLGNAIP